MIACWVCREIVKLSEFCPEHNRCIYCCRCEPEEVA